MNLITNHLCGMRFAVAYKLHSERMKHFSHCRKLQIYFICKASIFDYIGAGVRSAFL